MGGNFTAAIAWRYLRSKKSHSAVGTISTVSVCAMAIATAAIICVLSVFNGFRQVIGDKLDSLSPDLMITPAQGKVFDEAESLAQKIAAMPEVARATPTLSDNALLICNSKEMPVKVKGVYPAEYAAVNSIREIIPEEYGNYIREYADDAGSPDSSVSQAVVAIGTASRMRAFPGTGAVIFAPKREGRVNLANPAASFISDSIAVTGIYRADQAQFDEDGVILPIQLARDLFLYDSQASAVEVRLKPGINPEKAMKIVAERLGDKFEVKDRLRQQEMNFRMIAIEKWVSFLLLVFILIIAGFNIISALSMLVLEKEDAIFTLSSMGLSRRRIGRVFAWESIYVSLAGGICGIVLGLFLCLIQQYFGIIKIGGDPSASIVTSYPVLVQPLDILITLAPIVVLGLITAGITAAFSRTRISQSAIA